METNTQTTDKILEAKIELAKKMIMETFLTQFQAISNTVKTFPVMEALKIRILNNLDDALVWAKESSLYFSFEKPETPKIVDIFSIKETEMPDSA